MACEDTRRTGRCCSTPASPAAQLLTVNDHTEASRVGEVLPRLARGERVAVVTDAGTPGISDPGERLVRAAIGAGPPRSRSCPGPRRSWPPWSCRACPPVASCSRVSCPGEGSARAERLAALADEERTIVLYEAPHRAARTLADLVAAFGPGRRVADRPGADQAARGGVAGHAWPRRPSWMAAEPPRGELVFVVEGAPPPGAADRGRAASAAAPRPPSSARGLAAVKERVRAVVAATLRCAPTRSTLLPLALRLRAGAPLGCPRASHEPAPGPPARVRPQPGGQPRHHALPAPDAVPPGHDDAPRRRVALSLHPVDHGRARPARVGVGPPQAPRLQRRAGRPALAASRRASAKVLLLNAGYYRIEAKRHHDGGDLRPRPAPTTAGSGCCSATACSASGSAWCC